MKLVLFSRYSNTASKYLVCRNARLCVLQNIALQVSRVMRKLTFCICESKGTDQLRVSRAGDQRLCFRYIDTSSSKIQNFKSLPIFCGHPPRFVSDLVGNPEDRFCLGAVQIELETVIVHVIKENFTEKILNSLEHNNFQQKAFMGKHSVSLSVL